MRVLQALEVFSGGVAFITIAVALTWNFWVVYGGRPQGALPGTHCANGVATGPLIALGGLAMIIWSFTLQPVVAGIACMITVPVTFIVLRRAFRRTKRARANSRT